MALTQASLSTKLQTEIQNLLGTADDTVQLKKMTDAIAKAVVDEIKANAVVPAGIAVVVSTGSGIGATTGTGTVI